MDKHPLIDGDGWDNEVLQQAVYHIDTLASIAYEIKNNQRQSSPDQLLQSIASISEDLRAEIENLMELD